MKQVSNLNWLTGPVFWGAAWGAVLLFSAGTLTWLSGWTYIIWNLGLAVLSNYLLRRNSPEIAVERSRGPFQQEQTLSDKVVLAAMITTRTCLLIVAGFDNRYGWSDVPAVVRALGASLIAIKYYSIYRVAIENKYAAGVVKIQKSRGHHVVDTGPYRYVRHPMYIGLICATVGTPLLLGSWWGLCPASVLIILVPVRIVLEEKTLGTGLDGYTDYTARVPYRLIPGVW